MISSRPHRSMRRSQEPNSSSSPSRPTEWRPSCAPRRRWYRLARPWSARRRASTWTPCLRVSELLDQELRRACSIVVLSGPSFAVELARELADGRVRRLARQRGRRSACRRSSGSHYLRLYGTDDVVGVEIGGALKNVIAIAAGVVEGLGLGHNALAALITRGLAEMSRLACAAGRRRETLCGARRARRSRADLHGRAEPESPCRHRAGAAGDRCRRSSAA